MRYNFTNTNLRYDGKEVQLTTLLPPIIENENDIFIRVKERDRLDHLADKYYNDVNYWWVIAQANKLGKGKLALTPGEIIRIPAPSSLQNILNRLRFFNE